MTASEQLDTLETLIGHAMSAEALIMIARELVAIARKSEHDAAERTVVLMLENEKLRSLLRTALREWVMRTPDVEEVAVAWQMAREAGLQ